MNVFAKFDEIPSKTLQDIKETKRHGHTFVRSFGRTDNVKTVYPPTNIVCGGYNKGLLAIWKELSARKSLKNARKENLELSTNNWNHLNIIT